MSKSNWAEEDSDEDLPDVTPEEALQDKLLDQVDRNRGSAPPRENRSRSGSNVSGGGGGGDRSRNRGHRDQSGSQGGGVNGGRMGDGYQNNRSGDGYDRVDSRGDHRGGPPQATDIPKNGPYIAYVGNLNYATSAQTVGEYFQGGGCDVTDVKILTERDGRPRGFANVTFSDRESLVAAMEADGTDLEGRSISCRVDRRAGTERQRRSYNDRDDGPGAADSEEAWGRGARTERPARERREREPRAPRAEEAPKTRPVLNLTARTVPVDAAPSEVPRSSSIFGEATPVDVKEKVVEKPKPKPKPRADREGRERSDRPRDGPPGGKDKDKKAQRSDGSWTKEKIAQGDKKILQREQDKSKGKAAEKDGKVSAYGGNAPLLE